MTKYRGVEQRAIIDSARKAEAFLRKLDLGLYTEAWLDAWQEDDPYAQIMAARTEQDLSHAMKISMTGFAFLPYREVFEHEALTRLAEKGDDSVLRIYAALQSWGAFDQNIRPELPEIPVEVNFYMIEEYLDHWRAADTSPGSAAAATFAQAIEDARKENKTVADQAESMLPILELLDDSSDAEGLIRTIIESPEVIGVVKDAVRKTTPGYRFKDRLDVPTPLTTYRVSIGPMPANVDDLKPMLIPILEDMLTALIPYLLLDEVVTEGDPTKISISLQPPEGDEDMVLIFKASRRAAQDVAKALPGFIILDKDMKRVNLDRGPGPGPAPGRAPQPGF